MRLPAVDAAVSLTDWIQMVLGSASDAGRVETDAYRIRQTETLKLKAETLARLSDNNHPFIHIKRLKVQ